MPQYIGCAIRQLPPHQHVEAAARAIKINPSNAPARPPALAALAPLSPEHLALLTSKYWGTKGVKLLVSFLDDPDAETRRKILAHMNAWGTRCNVSFVETASGGQVRIARARSGYWSYLGTDILSIPPNEATMNLQGFVAQTPDSEYHRVVRHETGHTLGFPHEHTRREIIDRLDPQKTIAYFLANDGWDAQTTTQQVLTPLADADLTALPSDVRSIMCYQLPAEITRDGAAIPGGLDIDEEDYRLAAQLYPLAVNPPPGPGPGPGPSAGGRLFGLTFSRQVPARGRVSFPAPVAIPAGRYAVVHDDASSDVEALAAPE